MRFSRTVHTTDYNHLMFISLINYVFVINLLFSQIYRFGVCVSELNKFKFSKRNMGRHEVFIVNRSAIFFDDILIHTIRTINPIHQSHPLIMISEKSLSSTPLS